MGFGCSPKIGSYTGQKVFKTPNGVPDYADLNYWAAHPNKWDPSDTNSKIIERNSERKRSGCLFLFTPPLIPERCPKASPMQTLMIPP